ncbi:MAG: hypothetical protein EA424_16180 [Planctomycetaceae bacterium]|nr:MAG: hypothetical protein EA424_16180 [Planctomycetaceae bacterium]
MTPSTIPGDCRASAQAQRNGRKMDGRKMGRIGRRSEIVLCYVAFEASGRCFQSRLRKGDGGLFWRDEETQRGQASLFWLRSLVDCCLGYYAGEITMPRPSRADEAGGLYHALNRGNLRAKIFQLPTYTKSLSLGFACVTVMASSSSMPCRGAMDWHDAKWFW